MEDSIFGEVIDMKSAHDIWIYLNEKYGMISNDDDEATKEEAHECVKHDHNLVIVEDCSTSWSSDDDDHSTSSSLDKIDDVATSDAHDDSTSSILGGDLDDVGSCSSHDHDATTRSPTSPHCFMSQGDTKVQNANVVDHVNSYDELVDRLYSMTMSLENEKAKTMKLENENSFLKNSYEEHKHLLNVLKPSHGELKLTHKKLLASHEELLEQHASLIKVFSKKLKKNEISSYESSDQLQHVTNSYDIGKKHVSTSCDELLDMPCSSSISCETNILKENNELKREVKKLSNKLEVLQH
jgi:hypothetical protein